MQTSCCIYNNNICAISVCTLKGIKSNAGWVRTHLLLDYRNANTLTPYRNLFYSSSTECISCSNINFLTCIFKLISQFTYRRSLTNSVYAYNKYYVRFMISWQIPTIIIICIVFSQQIGNLLTQYFIEFRG